MQLYIVDYQSCAIFNVVLYFISSILDCSAPRCVNSVLNLFAFSQISFFFAIPKILWKCFFLVDIFFSGFPLRFHFVRAYSLIVLVIFLNNYM